ncbi:MAG: hypothetical protein ACYSR5_09510 [Planctomycetota bacterium]|jgi:uncharacterized membrane protein
MKKWGRIALVVSILLNVGLITGLGFCRVFVRSHGFKLAAAHFEAEAGQLEYILSELEPNDPERISSLKEYLRKRIESSKGAARTSRGAASK